MGWIIDENKLPLKSGGALATVFTIGNGTVCTRGMGCETSAGFDRGTYVSGLFTTGPRGYDFLMQAPDWLAAAVALNGLPAAAVSAARTLDLRRGLFCRSAVLAAGGARIRMTEERFLSCDRPYLGGQRIRFSELSGVDRLDIAAGVDTAVRNSASKYYQDTEYPIIDNHAVSLSTPLSGAAGNHAISAVIRGRADSRRAAVFARINAAIDSCEPLYQTGEAGAWARWSVSGESLRSEICIEKLAIITADIGDWQDAIQDSERLRAECAGLGYETAFSEHCTAIERFWRSADVIIEGDRRSQDAVRFALWSTRIAAPLNDGESSIGARNLNGDLYRGGVFWDMDMFQLPLLAATAPELARNHLRYRYRMLEAARFRAAMNGYAGADYPMTAYKFWFDRPETSFTRLEAHVNAAIGYALMHYYWLSDDHAQMVDSGAEIFFALCLFWESRAEYDAGACRWRIRRVCGPDEFRRAAVDDNAYTNLMAAWMLREAGRLYERLSGISSRSMRAILTKLQLDNSCFQRWQSIADAMYVPVAPGKRLLAQHAGYNLAPEPNSRLNRGQWGMIDRTAKQADTILLWQTRVPSGYQHDRDMMNACFAEYAPICHHLSTLSHCTHSLIAIERRHKRDMERFFRLAAETDLSRGDGSGTHGAGEGGLWIVIVHGFGGLHIMEDGVHIEPALPPFWERLTYRFVCKGQPAEVTVLRDSVTVANRGSEKIDLLAGKTPVSIRPAEQASIAWCSDWEASSAEAVVLAIDAVLVNMDLLREKAWKKIAAAHGLTVDRAALPSMRSIPDAAAVALVLEANEAATSERAGDIEVAYAQALAEAVEHAGGSCVAHGAKELLKRLRGLGLRIAAATSHEHGEQALRAAGLVDLVDEIVDAHKSLESVPDQDAIVVACQRLRVLSWNCVGVAADGKTVQAMKNAPMAAIAVGDTAADATLQASGNADIDEQALAGALEAFDQQGQAQALTGFSMTTRS